MMPVYRSRDTVDGYYDPQKELNGGLWSLWAGATAFLGLRIWIKLTRRHGLWWDDYILLASWVSISFRLSQSVRNPFSEHSLTVLQLVLLVNDALISTEYATGYVTPHWDDRMHILINITSCGTLIGQAWSKTAFAVTLLKLTKDWQRWILWFCIATMNAYMIVKVIFQWAKVCGKDDYQQWYRLNFCIGPKFRDDFKEGGNGESKLRTFEILVR